MKGRDMLVRTIFALAVLAGLSMAQELARSQRGGPLKNAGVYHVATKTWTRTPGPTANLGPDTVYANDAADTSYYFWDPSGYWGGFPYAYCDRPEFEDQCHPRVIDDGRIPRTYNADGVPWTQAGSGAGPVGTSADPAVTGLADRAGYRINGFQWAYCVDDLGTDISWHFNFLDEYNVCGSGHPTAGFDGAGFDIVGSAVGLPGGGGVLGSTSCWVVTIDLSNTSLEWLVSGDGGDQDFDDSFSIDSFGWQHTMTGVLSSVPTTFDAQGQIVTQGSLSGPVIAGDPGWVFRGEATYAYTGPIGPGADVPGVGHTNPITGELSGSGLGDFDGFEFNHPTWSCGWFGGYRPGIRPFLPAVPYGSFWFKLFADRGEQFLGTVDAACTAMPNSTGDVARLSVLGRLGDTCDTDDLFFKCDQQPAHQFGYLVFANGTSNIASGDGTLCVQPMQRLKRSVRRASYAGLSYVGTAGRNPPYYEEYWRLIPGGFNANAIDTCALPGMSTWDAGETWYFQYWYRDSQHPDGRAWNFSDLRAVTF